MRRNIVNMSELYVQILLNLWYFGIIEFFFKRKRKSEINIDVEALHENWIKSKAFWRECKAQNPTCMYPFLCINCNVFNTFPSIILSMWTMFEPSETEAINPSFIVIQSSRSAHNCLYNKKKVKCWCDEKKKKRDK